MKKALVLALALIVLLNAGACASGGAADSGTGTGEATATPAAAPDGLVVAVTDADGNPVPGASVTLTDRLTLSFLTEASGPDGMAAFPDAAEGQYFLDVSASGYLNSRQDIDDPGGQTLTCVLEASAEIGCYLMAFNASTVEEPVSRVYLAQSDDGISWELFPGYEPFEGSGAAVLMEDGIITVYSETLACRYFISEDSWESPRVYDFYTEIMMDESLDDKSGFDLHELNRDPGFFVDRDGALYYIGANDEDYEGFYRDAFDSAYAMSMSLVALASDMELFGTLGWYYDDDRYLYEDMFSDSQRDARFLSHPTVIVGLDGYDLLQSSAEGIVLSSGTSLDALSPVPASDGSLFYTGENGGSTGFYDGETGSYVLYVAGPENSPSLTLFDQDTLDSLDASAARTIDLSFVGGMLLTFDSPRIWDTGTLPAESSAAEYQMVGLLEGWEWDTFIKTELGGTSYYSSGGESERTLNFTADSYVVYDYRDVFTDSFACSADIALNESLLSTGLAYCWKPMGAEMGGYLFSTDGSMWTLACFVPKLTVNGYAYSNVERIDTLASGAYEGDAAGCTMTVRFINGLCALYIDGVRVFEYQDAENTAGCSCGYVGFYCESGETDATADLTPLRLLTY